MKGSADKERMVWVFFNRVLEQLEKGTRLARSRQDRPVKEGVCEYATLSVFTCSRDLMVLSVQVNIRGKGF